MALLKSKPAPFKMPSLADADETYAGLVAKRAELHAKNGLARKARIEAERDLAADASPEVPAGVAALLGDGPTSKSNKRQILAEARRLEADIQGALTVVEQRIRDAQPAALRAAVALARPEYDRRLRALTDALKVAAVAHRELHDFYMDCEAVEVSPDRFGPRPFFLGDARDGGKIGQFLKETSHAE